MKVELKEGMMILPCKLYLKQVDPSCQLGITSETKKRFENNFMNINQSENEALNELMNIVDNLREDMGF